MKVIKRTHALQQAKIIVGYLQSHGVDAELLDAAMTSVLPVVPGGVRIAVPDEQEAEALRLIAEAESGASTIDDEETDE